MAAPVVWFEVAGRDLGTLTNFYEGLFGWKIDAANPMKYGMVDTGGPGGIPGGIFAAGADAEEYVTFYVAVPNINASLKDAEKRGAKVLQPRTALDNGPTIAMLADPEGHRIGLIEQD
jgi:predicted enzyme related to lactoylglutathione lyase